MNSSENFSKLKKMNRHARQVMEAFRVFPKHDHPIQPFFVGIRNLRLAASLTLGLCLANVAHSAPLAIDSIEVSPSPLATGQPFTLAITTSPEVTQATATVDFHPGKPQSQEIPLVKQGLIWTGSGVVPANIDHQLPSDTGAKVKVSAFDGKHHAEAVAHFPLNVNGTAISALFAGGILTVTGDDHDNNITVSRDIAGTLLVNGGAVPVIGGVPTVATTSLVRILGLKGNDVLLVDDLNGPMPPANLLGGEGDDTLTGSANADELDGGLGNDTLIGGDGDDVLMGGPGNDILIGGRGADQMIGGEDDDQFVWNPGDGSDVVEGQDGHDTLLFNGANINETVDISANGPRLRFFRNVAQITMDCDGVEQVIFRALGGADRVTINDMSGTQVTNVVVDLSGSTPGVGDSSADTVVVNGTATNDVITVKGSASEVNVLGLAASVTVLGGEQDLDELVISTLAGADSVDASAVQAGAIDLTLNGGDDDDLLIGGQGNDLLIGGRGNDTMLGGAGDDTFIWNPGEGSDVIEGQDGQDSMVFNGANINEKVTISANGQRLRFFRDIANITMDCDGVELVEFRALGGADTITVNDLSGTDVTRVNLDLAGVAASGVGDNSADTVIVNGTTGNDGVGITGAPASGVNVAGLAATVNIVGSEPAFDQLIIRLLDGDDVAEASGLQDGVIGLTLDGGPGNDVLIGSAGADVLLGGDGDDVLEGGPGQDVLDGGSGNNTLIQ